MMICTKNFYAVFSLNSHESNTENTLCHPTIRIMEDKKCYLQTYFAVKDKYISKAIRGCTNIQCYLKSKISIDSYSLT